MGLQSSDLQRIEQQYLSQTTECCWAICNLWLNCNMTATWDDLLDKLHPIAFEWNSIASGLYQYLKSELLLAVLVDNTCCFTMSALDM